MKPYSMYLDDIRDPKTTFSVIARSSAEAIDYFTCPLGCPQYISFDHDLGGEDTAMRVVKWLVERDLDMNGEFIPKNFMFNVHSANPVGADNIEGYLNSYLGTKKDIDES